MTEKIEDENIDNMDEAELREWAGEAIEELKDRNEIVDKISDKLSQDRLRRVGDLDKWMMIIGAGITGYQPEAYAVMDMACHELVKLRKLMDEIHAAMLAARDK